jgi:hypothetical protein
MIPKMPPEMSQFLAAVQSMQNKNINPNQILDNKPKEKPNPLPNNPYANKLIRDTVGCRLVPVAKELHERATKILASNKLDNNEVIDVISRAIATTLRTDQICRQQLSKTIIGHIEQEEETKATHNLLKETEKTVISLQQKLTEAINEVKHLEARQWQQVVAKFKLNPQENFYRITEEGNIELLAINCESCSGAIQANQLKQSILELEQKENNK